MGQQFEIINIETEKLRLLKQNNNLKKLLFFKNIFFQIYEIMNICTKKKLNITLLSINKPRLATLTFKLHLMHNQIVRHKKTKHLFLEVYK